MNIFKVTNKTKINDWIETINSIIEYIKALYSSQESTKEQLQKLEEKTNTLEEELRKKINNIKIPKIPAQNITKEKVNSIVSDIEKSKNDIHSIRELISIDVASVRNDLEMSSNDNATSIRKELSDVNYSLSSKIDEMKANFLNTIYPIGSIYMSMVETNPSKYFGGSWIEIEDTFLLASGKTYSCGSTGGESEHTLSMEESPEHTHESIIGKSGDHTHGPGSLRGKYRLYAEDENGKYFGAIKHTISGIGELINFDGATMLTVGNTSASGDHTHKIELSKEGKNKPHNNMPPYLVVHMWQRIK